MQSCASEVFRSACANFCAMKFRKKLRIVVENSSTRAGRIFNIAIQILIIISIALYAVSTLPDLQPQAVQLLEGFDLVCYIIFTIEYLLRIYVAKKPLKYIFSFYGIIDFLAILPFIASRQFDLRALRILRIFKILSALKLTRYSIAIKRAAIALRLIRTELVMFMTIAGIFIFLASAGIFYFEHDAQPDEFASIFHSLWWAIITFTTVGYGDVYPITAGGRVFTFFILIIGLGIVTIPAGLIASALTKAREIVEERREDEG